MRRRVPGVFLLAVLLAFPATADAGFRLVRVAGPFNAPVHLAAPRSDPGGTLYVVEQAGRIIRRAPDGSRRVFLDIRSRVSSGGERGLLSVAFPADYQTSRLLYVYYTNRSGDIRIARFRANSAGTDAIESTRRIILAVPHPGQSNHNGGQLAFGPDGLLYAGLGDGGGGCDPGGNAQNLRSRLGKVLRINPRTRSVRTLLYGMRNPWRFSFSRLDHSLWLADVGQDAWEEVDFLTQAQLRPTHPWNGGWDVYEGRQLAASASGCPASTLNTTGRRVRPISVYGHSAGRCSITGGFVYAGVRLARWRGWYFFGDYCSGEIWRLRRRSDGSIVRRLALDTSLNISSFGEGPRGELYVVAHGGSVYRLAFS